MSRVYIIYHVITRSCFPGRSGTVSLHISPRVELTVTRGVSIRRDSKYPSEKVFGIRSTHLLTTIPRRSFFPREARPLEPSSAPLKRVWFVVTAKMRLSNHPRRLSFVWRNKACALSNDFAFSFSSAVLDASGVCLLTTSTCSCLCLNHDRLSYAVGAKGRGCRLSHSEHRAPAASSS